MKVGEIVSIYEMEVEKVKGPTKKVSAIILNCNCEKFLLERIDSILNQTYPVSELVILDDSSTDDSVAVIKKKMKSIMIPVKLIENKKNSNSVFSRWQKGIEASTGDYFWIAEAIDSSDPRFLEEAMKGFLDPEVVLSYTSSAQIDEDSKFICENSQDFYHLFSDKRWDKPYVHDGFLETKEVLCVTNTILNVSSVVWKRGDYFSILEEAKKYQVVGDWYIYYQVLKHGKIAFSNQPYCYRRECRNNMIKRVDADIEYQEICSLQEKADTELCLGMECYRLQRLRRSYLDHAVSKEIRKKRIAWVISCPEKGSFKYQTIIQNINALVRYGYECDIYVGEEFDSTDEELARRIDSYYEVCAANCYVGVQKKCDYDLIFATDWTTIDVVKRFDVSRKAYLIQDLEAWFFPRGDNYLRVENSYRLDFHKITLGKWLSHEMVEKYHSKSQYFDFCVNLDIYRPLKEVQKENAICYIWQPEKARRCDYLALRALKLVKTMRPDVQIYVYGSHTKNALDFEAEKLGILSLEECNLLYNKCMVGLCMSASNPSRIPFEMMAAGLPVVELYQENNLYDFPNEGVLLAESSEEAIATALISLVDNKKRRGQMSKAGVRYMQNYPLSRGFEQFLSAVDLLLRDKDVKSLKIKPSYLGEPIVASSKVEKVAAELFQITPFVDRRGSNRRKLDKCKQFVKRATKSVVSKIDKITDKM